MYVPECHLSSINTPHKRFSGRPHNGWMLFIFETMFTQQFKHMPLHWL